MASVEDIELPGGGQLRLRNASGLTAEDRNTIVDSIVKAKGSIKSALATIKSPSNKDSVYKDFKIDNKFEYQDVKSNLSSVNMLMNSMNPDIEIDLSSKSSDRGKASLVDGKDGDSIKLVVDKSHFLSKGEEIIIHAACIQYGDMRNNGVSQPVVSHENYTHTVHASEDINKDILQDAATYAKYVIDVGSSRAAEHSRDSAEQRADVARPPSEMFNKPDTSHIDIGTPSEVNQADSGRNSPALHGLVSEEEAGKQFAKAMDRVWGVSSESSPTEAGRNSSALHGLVSEEEAGKQFAKAMDRVWGVSSEDVPADPGRNSPAFHGLGSQEEAAKQFVKAMDRAGEVSSEAVPADPSRSSPALPASKSKDALVARTEEGLAPDRGLAGGSQADPGLGSSTWRMLKQAKEFVSKAAKVLNPFRSTPDVNVRKAEGEIKSSSATVISPSNRESVEGSTIPLDSTPILRGRLMKHLIDQLPYMQMSIRPGVVFRQILLEVQLTDRRIDHVVGQGLV